MTHRLTSPCANCPFRSDRPFHLTAARALEIATCLREGGDFPCHKTLDYDSPGPDGRPDQNGPGVNRCAGMLIVMEKSGLRNRIMQIAQRLGLYDPTRLQMDAPVYESLDAWLAAFSKPREGTAVKHRISKAQERVLVRLASQAVGEPIKALQSVSAQVLLRIGMLRELHHRGDACTCYVITPDGIQWLRDNGHAPLADRYNPQVFTRFRVRPRFDSEEAVEFVVDARHARDVRESLARLLGAGMTQYGRTCVTLLADTGDPVLSLAQVEQLLEGKRDRRNVTHLSVNCLPNDPVDVRCGGPQHLGFDFVVLREHATEAIGLILRVLGEVHKPLASTTCDDAGDAAEAAKVWTLAQIETALRKDREVPLIGSPHHARAQRGYR